MPDEHGNPVIYIGPSIWRTFEMMSAAACQELIFHLGRSGMKFYYKPEWGDADIARSRSKVATQFLDSDADVLFIFDSDMQFKPDDAVRLCKAAMEKESIVGGVFVKRGGEHDPALPLPIGQDLLFYPSSQPVKCDYVSTGFAAIHRKVFEALVADGMPLLHPGGITKFYPFYHHNPGYEDFEGSTIWMSEDWALCSNAKKLGFECWLDPGIRLAHWGVYDWRLEDMLQSSEQRKRMDPTPLIIGRHWDEGHERKQYRLAIPQMGENKKIEVKPSKPRRKSAKA